MTKLVRIPSAGKLGQLGYCQYRIENSSIPFNRFFDVKMVFTSNDNSRNRFVPINFSDKPSDR